MKALLGDDVAISASLLFPREQIDLQLEDPEATLAEITGHLHAARASLVGRRGVTGPDTGGDYDDLRLRPAGERRRHLLQTQAAGRDRAAWAKLHSVWEAA